MSSPATQNWIMNIHDILTRHKRTDAQVGEMLAELEIPPAFIEPIREVMRKPGLLQNLTSVGHLNTLMEETLHNVWFTVRHGQHVAQAKKGSGPGDLLAGTIFDVIQTPVQRKIDSFIIDSMFAWYDMAASLTT